MNIFRFDFPAAAQCHDQNEITFIQVNTVETTDHCIMGMRQHRKRRIIGQQRYHFTGIFQQPIQLRLFFTLEPIQFVQFSVCNRILVHQLIDVKFVSFWRRNSSGRCVRLIEIAHLCQISHFITNGSTRKSNLLILRQIFDLTGSPVLIYASTIALRICRFRGLSVPSFFRMPHTSFPLHVMRHAIRSRKRFQRNQFSTLHITVLICKYSVPVSANIIKTYLITFNELFVNRNRLRWCAAKQTTIASSTKKCASKSNENNKKTANRISVIFLFFSPRFLVK